MTLTFFDFYPMIGKSSSFSDVFGSVGFYVFQVEFWVPIIGLLLISNWLIKSFHRKVYGYALAISGASLLILSCLNALNLGTKFSNNLLLASSQFICLFGIISFMYIKTLIIDAKGYEPPSNKCQSFSPITQFIMLSLILTSVFVYPYQDKWFVWILTLTYGIGLILQSHDLTASKVEYKTSDFFPFIALFLITLSVSYLKVGKIVCSIPWFRDHFSCPSWYY